MTLQEFKVVAAIAMIAFGVAGSVLIVFALWKSAKQGRES